MSGRHTRDFLSTPQNLAVGSGAVATGGSGAIALGVNALASGAGSIAIGNGAQSTNAGSTAIGLGAIGGTTDSTLITSSNTLGPGGTVVIIGKAGTPGNPGGDIGIVSGGFDDNTGPSQSGGVTIAAQNSTGAGNGGNVAIEAGNSDTGPGGFISITAGVNTAGDGGRIEVNGASNTFGGLDSGGISIIPGGVSGNLILGGNETYTNRAQTVGAVSSILFNLTNTVFARTYIATYNIVCWDSAGAPADSATFIGSRRIYVPVAAAGQLLGANFNVSSDVGAGPNIAGVTVTWAVAVNGVDLNVNGILGRTIQWKGVLSVIGINIL